MNIRLFIDSCFSVLLVNVDKYEGFSPIVLLIHDACTVEPISISLFRRLLICEFKKNAAALINGFF